MIIKQDGVLYHSSGLHIAFQVFFMAFPGGILTPQELAVMQKAVADGEVGRGRGGSFRFDNQEEQELKEKQTLIEMSSKHFKPWGGGLFLLVFSFSTLDRVPQPRLQPLRPRRPSVRCGAQSQPNSQRSQRTFQPRSLLKATY